MGHRIDKNNILLGLFKISRRSKKNNSSVDKCVLYIPHIGLMI